MPPNVLFIVLDAVRHDHVSCYGYNQPTTPNLDMFANDAVLFENAFAAAPWTPPSHASLFTGTYPSTHQYLDDGMTLKATPLAAILSHHDYHTYSMHSSSKLGSHTPLANGFDIVKELFRYTSIPSSVAEIYHDYLRYWYSLLLFGGQYLRERAQSPSLMNIFLKDWISNHATADQPFFIFGNYLCAHSKYDPPEPYWSEFVEPASNNIDHEIVDRLSDRGGYAYINGECDPSDQEWQVVKNRYDGEIAYADALVGDTIKKLKDTEQYNDTLIIVTADHGEHFGEHRRAYHQFSLYDELLHVPLLIKFPDQDHAGTTIQKLVSHVDLFPTILDVINIATTDDIDGQSILPIERHSRKAIFAEYGEPTAALNALKSNSDNSISDYVTHNLAHPLQCIRTDNAKYIRVIGGDDEFYDYEQSPNEEMNLISIDDINDDTREKIKYLKNELDDTVKTLPSPSKHSISDNEVRENLRDLGYL